MKSNNDELAAALNRYTNPHHIEWDAKFTAELISIRPDWFEPEELAYLKDVLKKIIK